MTLLYIIIAIVLAVVVIFVILGLSDFLRYRRIRKM
jgi:hypothetical protein